MAMKYEFARRFRQFNEGDPVPEAFDGGTIGTMLARQTIRPAGEKTFQPEADKALKPDTLKRKGRKANA